MSDDLSDSDRGRIATRIGRVLRMPVDKVLEIWGERTLTGQLAQTVNFAHERIESSRIKLLTPAMILQLATGTSGWRGAHAREVVGVALEHAPTWHFLYKQYRDKDALSTYSKTLGLLANGER